MPALAAFELGGREEEGNAEVMPWPKGVVEANTASEHPALLEQLLADARERIRRLGFVAPDLFDAFAREGAEAFLRRYDRDIVVVFADLRGFTHFTERHSLDRVTATLDEFYAAMGEAIQDNGGTLERFTGDGLMVFFDDLAPAVDATHRALSMALQMQSAAHKLEIRWRCQAIELALGIGIARGRARVGPIGCSWRMDYGAIGPVVNLAQRLCARAAAGEILMERSALARLGRAVAVQPMRPLKLAGFSEPVSAVSLIDRKRAMATKQSARALMQGWFGRLYSSPSVH